MFAFFLIFLGITFLTIGIYFFRESKSSTENLFKDKQFWFGSGSLFFGIIAIWLSQIFLEDNFHRGTLLLAIGIGLFTIGIVCWIIAIYNSTKKGIGVVVSSISLIFLIIGLITLVEPFRVHKWIREVLLISPNSIILIILAILMAAGTYEILKTFRSNTEFSHKKWWFICIAVLVIIALIEPYVPTLFHRMRGVKTPWFEADLDPETKLSIEGQQEYILRQASLLKAIYLKNSIEKVNFIIQAKMIDIKAKKIVSNDADHKIKLEEELDNLQEKMKSYNNFCAALNKIGFFKFLDTANSALQKNLGEGLIKQQAMCWVGKLKQVFENERLDLPCTFFDKIPKDISDNAELIRKNVAYYHSTVAFLLDFSEDPYTARAILAEPIKKQIFSLDFEKLALHGFLQFLIIRSRDQLVAEGLENGILHQEIALKAIQNLIELFSRIDLPPVFVPLVKLESGAYFSY